MLKAAFKTELIQADSPLLSHSSSTLIRRGKPVTVCQNTACTLSRLKSFLYSTEHHRQVFWGATQTVNSSMVYQSWRTKGLSAQEWKYPPVINRCIINPILCLGATDWLHASVTLSNLRVSESVSEKTLKYLSGHGVRCSPWNIHNLRAEQQWRRWQHVRIWLAETETLKPRWPISIPSPVVTHKFTFTSVFLDEWHKAICHLLPFNL